MIRLACTDGYGLGFSMCDSAVGWNNSWHAQLKNFSKFSLRTWLLAGEKESPTKGLSLIGESSPLVADRLFVQGPPVPDRL